MKSATINKLKPERKVVERKNVFKLKEPSTLKLIKSLSANETRK